jgi:hypothetical protein
MTSLVKPDSNYSIGKVVSGLILHPDNEHIIYPLGTTIVVRHIISRTQQFLRVGIRNDFAQEGSQRRRRKDVSRRDSKLLTAILGGAESRALNNCFMYRVMTTTSL